MSKTVMVSFRCYYSKGQRYTQHTQALPVDEIGKWISAYQFTHPAVYAISAKVWMNDSEEGNEE